MEAQKTLYADVSIIGLWGSIIDEVEVVYVINRLSNVVVIKARRVKYFMSSYVANNNKH